MKVLDFQCGNTECKHIFEGWVRMPDDAVVCPICRSTDTKIVFMHPPQTLKRKQPYDYLRHNDDPVIRSVVPKSYKKAKKNVKA